MLYLAIPKRVLAPVIFSFLKPQITVEPKQHVIFMRLGGQCSSSTISLYVYTYCHCDTSTMILTVSNIRMLMSFPSLSPKMGRRPTHNASQGVITTIFMWRKNVNCIGHAVFLKF